MAVKMKVLLVMMAMMVVVTAASALPAFAALPSEGNSARAAQQCFDWCYAPTQEAGYGYASRGYSQAEADALIDSAENFCESACGITYPKPNSSK
jgi:hypothetical protein